MTKLIKHVFFDLDHTLWDFDRNSGLTFEKIFKIHKLDLALQDFLNVYEPINFKYWKLYREERVSKSDLRYGRLKDAFTAINMEVSDEIIYQLSEDYITYLSNFNHVFEGTEDILNHLKQSYQLHIITNGFEEIQEKKMKTSNIRHHFKTVTNSEMVGVKKPNPKIFNFALEQAGAIASESIMIGDNLEADIEGAIAVGMESILFDYANRYPKVELNRVSQLKDLIRYL
ncbi:YjjG family noncanonical pyrimidine nucleotidase [Winogradskyella sp. A3E31]|uniref:YjjG family noncanonical pyrimidine nucleotidase n=1 Tax=Winogradskyella sp. A3E31 TaxID=3349637 RepID=UPI00398B97F7